VTAALTLHSPDVTDSMSEAIHVVQRDHSTRGRVHGGSTYVVRP
jgi:hypothetical protein